jgi:hypothetical protein
MSFALARLSSVVEAGYFGQVLCLAPEMVALDLA